MTILGPDLSSYQDGVNVSALPYPFVIAKCTEGTYYTDADYPIWHQQAAAAGKIFIPYHFVTGEDPDAQAKHLADKIQDKSLLVMLDFEPTANYKPPLQQLLAVADACHRAGLRVVLAYLPRWYWEELGSPDLRGLDGRGIHLVSSAYPGGSGYPGDGAAGWQSYGGMTPLIYQYTDAAPVQGRSVDMNAYRGDTNALTAQLKGTTIMATIPSSIGQFWPEIAAQFPAGQQYDADTALIWGDAGARAAALYAKEARDAVNVLVAKVTTPPAPAALTVDVDALAAALAPHLTAGASADQVAHAVVMHLGADLAAG